MATVITDSNIHDLVKLYYDFHYRNQENRLPEDLRDVSMNDWDVSNVTDMSNLFDKTRVIFGDTVAFNEPLDRWNVSNVKYMGFMFDDCVEFNQPIGNWDVKKVINMHSMFKGCLKFNQPLNNWRINETVVDITEMFYNAKSFHRSLNNWCVKRYTYQEGGIRTMFYNSPMEKYINIIQGPRLIPTPDGQSVGRQRLRLERQQQRNLEQAERMLPAMCAERIIPRAKPSVSLAPSVKQFVEPPKCMTEAEFDECSKNDEGVVEDPINFAELTRQTAVLPPGASKQCFDRAGLRKWVETKEEQRKVPTNPVTREVLPIEWILSNLKRGDNCVDEVVSSTSGGRRTRKARRRRTRTKANRRSKKARGGAKKAKRSRSRKHMTRRRKH